jgi:hypothetical protein
MNYTHTVYYVQCLYCYSARVNQASTRKSALAPFWTAINNKFNYSELFNIINTQVFKHCFAHTCVIHSNDPLPATKAMYHQLLKYL